MTTGKTVLSPGNFAKIADHTLAEYGLRKGDIIYIAGDYLLPLKEDNPHLLQRYFVAAKVVDGHIEAGQGNGFVVNPSRLVALSKVQEEKLQKIRDGDCKEGIADEGSS